MDEQTIPAIQLGKAAGLYRYFARFEQGESLQAILASPCTETVVLPVDWQSAPAADPAYGLELSTRGATPFTSFLWLIIEPQPSSYAIIGFSQNMVTGPGGGHGGRVPPIDWDRLDWVRWSFVFAPGVVTYRAYKHPNLSDPYTGVLPLPGVPFPHGIKAVVIGTHDIEMMAVADVRMWNGQLFDVLDEQLEFLGRRRLDGRELRLVGYWKLDEGSGTRLEDSSRFGHDGVLTGGRWLAASETDLTFDCSLDRVRQHRKALIDLAHAIRGQKDEIARQTQELQWLRKQIDDLKTEVESLGQDKEQVLTDQKRELAALEAAFQEWQERIRDGGKVGLDKFSESLSKEVEDASAELAESNSPYRLQSVAFDVKMLPVQRKGEPGFLVIFPQPEDKVQAAQLSTLNLSLEPRPSAPPREELEVPDVVGYTVLVAQRLLARKGFQVEVLDQATDKPGEIDRVIDQDPKGGTSTGPGQGLQQPIILFLGRAGDAGGG